MQVRGRRRKAERQKSRRMHAYITILLLFYDPSRHALPVHVTAQPKDVRIAVFANFKTMHK